MESTILNIWLEVGIALLAFVTAIWIISLLKKDAGIMDIFWGLGFILVAVITNLSVPVLSFRGQIVNILIILWGLRLSIHIGVRNIGESEDIRYLTWRKEAGSKWWWKSYFKVFILQGSILWIVSYPILSNSYYQEPSSIIFLDQLGIAIWLIGFSLETISDFQLAIFKTNPANKGKLLTSGLWKYSRHPNYFGEAIVWWGIFVISISVESYLAIVSPLIMTYLLIKVSGVAMLERFTIKKYPDYSEYVKNTNAFIPGWRK